MKRKVKWLLLPTLLITSLAFESCGGTSDISSSSSSEGKNDTESPLIISEIVTGSRANDVAIELFNNSNKELSLKDYSLDIQFNEEYTVTISLAGKLAAQTTYVIVNEVAETEELKEKADLLTYIGLKDLEVPFTGRQPIALKKGKQRVDITGIWNYFEDGYASDLTLARKKEFLIGRNEYVEYDWIRYGENEFSYLGTIDVSVTEAQLLAGPKLEDKDVEAPFSKEDGRGGYIGGGGLMGATVRAYIDGDTTRFNYSDTAELEKLGISQGEKVRYQNIDTPESYVGNIQRFGLVAKQYTHDILASAKSIYVQTTKDGSITETFGRILGWVWADGKLVNFEVVKRGYSEVAFGSNDTMVYRGVSYTSYLYNAMLYAKSQLLGVHADPDGKYGEIDPYWDYDKNQVKDEYSNGNPK